MTSPSKIIRSITPDHLLTVEDIDALRSYERRTSRLTTLLAFGAVASAIVWVLCELFFPVSIWITFFCFAALALRLHHRNDSLKREITPITSDECQALANLKAQHPIVSYFVEGARARRHELLHCEYKVLMKEIDKRERLEPKVALYGGDVSEWRLSGEESSPVPLSPNQP